MYSDGGAETSVTNTFRPQPNSPVIADSNNIMYFNITVRSADYIEKHYNNRKFKVK